MISHTKFQKNLKNMDMDILMVANLAMVMEMHKQVLNQATLKERIRKRGVLLSLRLMKRKSNLKKNKIIMVTLMAANLAMVTVMDLMNKKKMMKVHQVKVLMLQKTEKREKRPRLKKLPKLQLLPKAPSSELFELHVKLISLLINLTRLLKC